MFLYADCKKSMLHFSQDPVDKDLLFLGTELGLWASFDGGAKWHRWNHGVPTTSVMDLVVHPREHDGRNGGDSGALLE